MLKKYQLFCSRLHQFTLAACVVLLMSLLVAQVSVVMLRYCFGIGYLELQDFTAYVFATMALLSIPVALVMDRHVRVDVLRERQSRKTRLVLDRAAILLLLMPAFILTAYLVYPDIAYAWKIREGSRETGGLPGVFLVKSVLPVTCALMVLQGIAILLAPGLAASDAA